MDMVYCDQPIFVLFPIVLLSWQVFCCRMKKKHRLSALADVVLTGIGGIGHAVAICVILLGGGTLSDALLLVLLSAMLSLLLSPKSSKEVTEEQEGSN